VAILNAGAYGYSLSSNYLVRPRVPEIGSYEGEVFQMRRRESVDNLNVNVNWERFEQFLN
jgi:diaminopimelate decarboxylase